MYQQYKIGAGCQVISVKLREAIGNYERRTGKRLTYAELAKRAGLSRATVEALGSRTTYNTTLQTIDRLCAVLECDVADLLEYRPSSRRTSKK